jgi:hypothetical protein
MFLGGNSAPVFFFFFTKFARQTSAAAAGAARTDSLMKSEVPFFVFFLINEFLTFNSRACSSVQYLTNFFLRRSERSSVIYLETQW